MKKIITDAQNKAKEAARDAQKGLKKGGQEARRRGSEALQVASNFLTEASQIAAEFASSLSRVMNDVHSKFEKFKYDLEKATTPAQKEVVVNNAVDLATTTHANAFRMSQRSELPADEQHRIVESFRDSVKERGLDGLEEDLKKKLHTLQEEKEYVPGSMAPPPPPPAVGSAVRAKLPPLPASRPNPPVVATEYAPVLKNVPPINQLKAEGKQRVPVRPPVVTHPVATSPVATTKPAPIVPRRPTSAPNTSTTEEVVRKPNAMELALQERKKGLKEHVEKPKETKPTVQSGTGLAAVMAKAMEARRPYIKGGDSDDDDKPTNRSSKRRGSTSSWQ